MHILISTCTLTHLYIACIFDFMYKMSVLSLRLDRKSIFYVVLTKSCSIYLKTNPKIPIYQPTKATILSLKETAYDYPVHQPQNHSYVMLHFTMVVLKSKDTTIRHVQELRSLVMWLKELMDVTWKCIHVKLKTRTDMKNRKSTWRSKVRKLSNLDLEINTCSNNHEYFFNHDCLLFSIYLI
jgi:hypothetical protein